MTTRKIPLIAPDKPVKPVKPTPDAKKIGDPTQHPFYKYMNEELIANTEALKEMDNLTIDYMNSDDETKKLRELQSMILRIRINELQRHLNVLKYIHPHG